jgi:hypothetical protein
MLVVIAVPFNFIKINTSGHRYPGFTPFNPSKEGKEKDRKVPLEMPLRCTIHKFDHEIKSTSYVWKKKVPFKIRRDKSTLAIVQVCLFFFLPCNSETRNL